MMKTTSIFKLYLVPMLCLYFAQGVAQDVSMHLDSLYWEDTENKYVILEAFTNDFNGSAFPKFLATNVNEGDHFMIQSASSSNFADDKFAFGGGSRRLGVYHNSNTTDVHLRLIEPVTNDFARMAFNSTDGTNSFIMGARPDHSDPDWFIGYNTDKIMYVEGDTKRVGILDDDPRSDFHIKQSDDTDENGDGGITIEHNDNTNNWRTYMYFNSSLSWNYNNERVRYFTTSGDAIQSGRVSTSSTTKSVKNGLSQALQIPLVSHVTKSNHKTLAVDYKKTSEVFPEGVTIDEDGSFNIIKANFGLLAIGAIQDQQSIIDDLKTETTEMKKMISQLAETIQMIQND